MVQPMLSELTELGGGQNWVLQVPVAPITTTPEEASVLFSGPQFFIALIAGILLAFAIQILLTNLSVAAGISYLGHATHSGSSRPDDRDLHDVRSPEDLRQPDHHSGGFGATIRKVSFGVGLWTLITVSIALFIACFLAVELSLLVDPGLGAIVGLVIWAAYFTLLVWFSSTTVGSLIGSIVNTATSGFQTIVGTAAAALGMGAVNRQMVATAEAAAAAVRNEIGSAIDPESIRESVEDYLHRIRLPEFDMGAIRRDFEDLIRDPEIEALAASGQLKNVNRQTFIDLISRRTDFSKQEVTRLADLLEGVWRQTLGSRQQRDHASELIDYLQSTQPGQLRVNELNARIERLADEVRALRQQQGGSTQQSEGGYLQQALQSSLTTATGLLMGRIDVSDLDISSILNRLKDLQDQVKGQAGQLSSQVGSGSGRQPYSPIRADVENYLLNTYSWQMNRETIDREFRDVLYDPTANPAEVHRQLLQLNRSFFVDVLTSRGLLTQDQIQSIADQLEKIRREVVAVARGAEEREAAIDLRRRIETYLTLTPRDQLFSPNSEGILPGFKALLEQEDADYDTLSLRLAPYDRETLRQLLLQRQDIASEEAEPILNALEATRNRVLFESQSLDQQAKQRAEDLQQRVESYLRNTGRNELDPEGIKRELRIMLEDPQTGLTALRHRASHFNRDTYVQLLSQRGDISEEDANRIVDQVESTWNTVLHSPQLLAGQAREQYDRTMSAIADYLRRTNLEELNPEGIQRDLTTLLSSPQEGAQALRQRLSKVDRETLVRLLAQRQDLSREQVNQAIDKTQEAINRIVKTPRRLALRAQQRVVDFESSVEDYLRNTNKEELNPEAIKRDLQLLVNHPRWGLQNMGDRLSRFDRSTVVALLAQRPDMTREEAERVVGQFESVRDQIIDQFRQVQYRIQSAIDRIFDRIRDYLNSLERPELNYDGIKRDIRTLFDDPQAGFEALRMRLSSFDRDTLVAILSSRKDISEADANRIIDQIEGARNSVLRRAERIQMEAQRRLEEVKQQVQHQAEETRKAAAAAAWWLFATAVVSAATAAIGGALAVT